MDGGTYKFDSTVEIRLTNFLGIPRVTTPPIKLRGPATVVRSRSTAPGPGKFRADLQLTEMNLTGKVLGVEVKVSLNSDHDSKGAVEGRADPKSPNPQRPDPIGMLKSNFDVYINVTTPFGTTVNKEPIGMRAQIKSVPPDWAKYKQYTPPRTLFDKVVGMMMADLLHATHVVKLVNPKPGGGGGIG
jgi:hypothetical protein